MEAEIRYDALRQAGEDLTTLQDTWIRSRPDLWVLPQKEMNRLSHRVANAIPDIAERRRKTIADVKPVFAVMVAFSEWLGETFRNETVARPLVFEGKPREAHGFRTRTGAYAVIFEGDEALLFKSGAETPLHRVRTEELRERFPFRGHESYLRADT